MRKVLTTVLCLLAVFVAGAQNVSDLIISEALAAADSSGIRDDYGRAGGWVELYNRSTGTVNFGGCFLTDDRQDLRKSPIPKSDLRTKLGPRQVALFFCSGNGADGTFYAGFTLEPGKTVYLVSNDGHTIIDSLALPATLAAGQSVQKTARDIRQQHFEPLEEPCVPSPGILNGHQNSASKAEQMAVTDPHGWTLTIVSVSVVFCALALLWFLFWLLFDRPARKKMALASQPVRKDPDDEAVAAAIALALDMEQDGDVYAAIATAVHLYLSDTVHDVEPGIVTIRRQDSGWTNKALLFRRTPQQ